MPQLVPLQNNYQSIDQYLPHTAPMILLDHLVFIDEKQCICKVTITPSGRLSPFLNSNNELPSWFAMELMAQTIGVWNGYHGQIRQHKPKLGMLLGCRGFKSKLANFPIYSSLEIDANLNFHDNKLANFDCHINLTNENHNQENVCHAKLNVYEPDENELALLFSRSKSK
ncbi:hypothetical protein PT276_05285 [Orbaceae bacterium ESL0721]|nr:hypothetical protein [Orbaceae bacterium ESL0721]